MNRKKFDKNTGGRGSRRAAAAKRGHEVLATAIALCAMLLCVSVLSFEHIPSENSLAPQRLGGSLALPEQNMNAEVSRKLVKVIRERIEKLEQYEIETISWTASQHFHFLRRWNPSSPSSCVVALAQFRIFFGIRFYSLDPPIESSERRILGFIPDFYNDYLPIWYLVLGIREEFPDVFKPYRVHNSNF